MNPIDHPSLVNNEAVAGIVFSQPESVTPECFDRKKMEKSCVDLISKLEHELAIAKGMSQVDYVDESATVAGAMIDSLKVFTEAFLDGKAKEQTIKEIACCQTMCDTYEEVLKTRSIGNTLLRTFWKADESVEILASREKLGASLVRASAATLYHAINLIGLDTEFGKQIDESADVFVNQLEQSW